MSKALVLQFSMDILVFWLLREVCELPFEDEQPFESQGVSSVSWLLFNISDIVGFFDHPKIDRGVLPATLGTEVQSLKFSSGRCEH